MKRNAAAESYHHRFLPFKKQVAPTRAHRHKKSCKLNMPESYYHQPLPLGNWIRVLELAPSKNSDAALQCRLLRLLLTDQSPALPHYEALSYVWGERAGSRKLICEGRTLLITSNCEGALRRLRHARKPRRLWVDSICIDQKSTEERNHQVGLMGYVYSKALQVIVWLGEGNESTSAGMQQLRHYGRIATILGYNVSSALKPLIHKRLNHHSGQCNVYIGVILLNMSQEMLNIRCRNASRSSMQTHGSQGFGHFKKSF